MGDDGNRRASVDGAVISVNGTDIGTEDLGMVTRCIGFECSSGRWIEHEWTGIPINRLLSAADAPPESTHVKVEATDGHTACVALPAALDGLLALEQGGERLAGPRFVAPGIAGPRAVSDVTSLEFLHLSPDDDPKDHESMDLVTG